MPLSLSSAVTDVPRIGPAKAQILKKLGITHARDFLYTFPRRYDDFSRITRIADLKVGEKMTVRGRIKSVNPSWGFQGRRRVLRIFVDIEDESGVLAVTWYNLRFLVPQLVVGRELFVAGTVELSSLRGVAATKQSSDEEIATPRQGEARNDLLPKFAMRSPVLEFVNAQEDHTHTARITPVYPETHGVTSRFLRYQVKNLLPLLTRLPEYMPEQIRARNHLMGIQEAIRQVHFPENAEQLTAAQRRLRFDELFFLQAAALVRRQQRATAEAPIVKVEVDILARFVAALPFALTRAQETAIQEVISDMAKGEPMNRLLQGDVGSGKSVVALIATYVALEAGYSVLYLAPTEILARQQADSFTQSLGAQRVALLLGAHAQKEKETIKERLASHEALCVVGTHAVLQEDVQVDGLGLAIVDEQHRFGVAQRRMLQTRAMSNATSSLRPSASVIASAAKQSLPVSEIATPCQDEARNDTTKQLPHLLSMTATPIPRTLSLTVYGDLEVTVLDELPPGRKPVKTAVVSPDDREAAILHILEQLHAGRQAFVIAPLIEKSAKLEAKSAKETAEEMHALFPDIAVGLLHGQMTSEEKESVMKNFAAGALQLLVSTAVVEVGVNVPNATIMIIEGAERFGLSQLHQFRGRIGRGEHESFCYLFPTTAEAARSQRLQILAATNDGFKIAEKDLELRGPGEMYGVAQSGFGNLQVASLLDYETIKLAREEAQRLLTEDPELKNYPIIRKKVEQKNLVTHFE